MIGRLAYRFAVWITAWMVRPCPHGHQRFSDAETLSILGQAYKRRDVAWRMRLLEDAQARNRARMSRA